MPRPMPDWMSALFMITAIAIVAAGDQMPKWIAGIALVAAIATIVVFSRKGEYRAPKSKERLVAVQGNDDGEKIDLDNPPSGRSAVTPLVKPEWPANQTLWETETPAVRVELTTAAPPSGIIRAQVGKASWARWRESHPNDCPIEGAEFGADALWWIGLATAEDVFDLMPCVVESVGENDPYRVLIYDSWIE